MDVEKGPDLLATITGYFGDESFIGAPTTVFNLSNSVRIEPVVPAPAAGSMLLLGGLLSVRTRTAWS